MVETANQLAVYDAKAYLAWMELENRSRRPSTPATGILPGR